MKAENKKYANLMLLLCFSASLVASTRKFSARDSRNGENVLDQDTRSSIYKLIRDKEGLHFREICRILDKRMGVVQYHISVLEKTNYVKSVRDGRYKCFFPVKNEENHQIQIRDDVDQKMRETIMTSLRRKTPKVLLQYLIENPSSSTSHQELSDICGVSPQAITFHCQRLEKSDVIESRKDGRQKYYSLTGEALKIIHTMHA